mgnify:CR=1 FL=1
MNDKTELEFGGATISGSKILLIVPLLGAIGGSMWGGFEVYTIEVDVRQSESIARTAEDTVADTTRELRDDVYALEERVNDTLRDVDLELREIRDDLESRIQQMLDNPLNDNE